jgi:hypothetical protein
MDGHGNRGQGFVECEGNQENPKASWPRLTRVCACWGGGQPWKSNGEGDSKAHIPGIMRGT